MPSHYTLKIAGFDALQKGIYEATIKHDCVSLVISEKGKTLSTATLAANRTSFSSTEETTKAKINLMCERLGIQDSQLSYNRDDLSKTIKLLYKLRFLKKITFEALVPIQWVIVYRNEQDIKWNKLVPDPHLFQADPFIVFKNNKYYVFYEELKFENWRGYLRVAELDINNNCFINDKIILELDYHLSYPNVFEENGTYYMIPESAESNSIDLFECIDFPYRWQKKQTLIDNIKAVDTTPLKQNGSWYLFTTEIIDGADYYDELSIYKSKDLFKQPFTKLYDEPVISDVTNARMAGHFIHRNGDIFRVSQNCGKRYGYQTNINKVIQIEGGYKEELIETIKPTQGALGLHTYNQTQDIIIGDMEIARFDFYSLRRFIGGNLKRLLEIILGKNNSGKN